VHVLYYSFVNPPRCTPENYIDFLVASPGPVSCSEAARVQPHSPFAPAHDSYNRLLNRLEPDPEALWAEAEPLVAKARGALIIDDSTLDKRRAKHIGLVTRHWSGKPKKVVRGINLSTLWSDGDRKIPCDYRLFSKADGKTKHDHFFEMLLMAKGRGFSPKYVLFDTWYASLENLKQVRDFGWLWLTRLRGDRKVSPADRRARALDDVPVSEGGTVLHLRGYGLVKVDQRPVDGRGGAEALRRGQLRDRELPPGAEAVLRGRAVPGPRQPRAAEPHRAGIARVPAVGVAFLHHRDQCVPRQVGAGA
jgi:hypothetical protein